MITVTFGVFNKSQAIHLALYLDSSISSYPDRGNMTVSFIGNEGGGEDKEQQGSF